MSSDLIKRCGLAIAADMSDRTPIRGVVAQIEKSFGRLDCLVDADYDARVDLFDALTETDARPSSI